jgi:hypothetical protein
MVILQRQEPLKISAMESRIEVHTYHEARKEGTTQGTEFDRVTENAEMEIPRLHCGEIVVG